MWVKRTKFLMDISNEVLKMVTCALVFWVELKLGNLFDILLVYGFECDILYQSGAGCNILFESGFGIGLNEGKSDLNQIFMVLVMKH